MSNKRNTKEDDILIVGNQTVLGHHELPLNTTLSIDINNGHIVVLGTVICGIY